MSLKNRGYPNYASIRNVSEMKGLPALPKALLNAQTSHTKSNAIAVQRKQINNKNKAASTTISEKEFQIINILQRDKLYDREGIPSTILFKLSDFSTHSPEGNEAQVLLRQKCDMKGLIDGLSLREMQRVLKAQEKYLLIQLLKMEWNKIRLPYDKWYEITDKSFTYELERNRALIASKSIIC